MSFVRNGSANTVSVSHVDPARSLTSNTAYKAVQPDTEMAAQPLLAGFEAIVDSKYRPGVMRLSPESHTATAAPETWFHMKVELEAGGKRAADMLSFISGNLEEARAAMQSRVIDVHKVGVKTVDRRKAPKYRDDRVEAVVLGIRELVGQMSAQQNPHSNQLKLWAQTYGSLRDEMAKLRAAMLEAEGNFELAQVLVCQRLEGSE